jgi:hypothetical protein
VVAAGSRPLRYQWLRNGVALPGATYAYLFVTGLGLADNGALYSVVVSNSVGSVTSVNAVVNVVAPVPAAPKITVQPASTSAPEGQLAVFAVAATGTPAPTYQWQRNGVPIAGATSVIYSLPAVTAADNGAVFTVVVSNSLGQVTSTPATLTLTPAAGSTDKEKLLRLMNLSFEFYYASAAPLEAINDTGDKFINPATLCASGTGNITLNGSAIAANQAVPASGTLAGTFANCATSNATTYTGSSSAVYNFSSLATPTGTATTTANNMRVRTAAGVGAGTTVVQDLTANGTGTVTFQTTVVGAQTTASTQISQSPGATLRNELSGLTARFAGGSVGITTVSEGNKTLQLTTQYKQLSFQVDGITYVADGSTQISFGTTGLPSGSGEAVLTSNGARVGRLFFDAQGVFSVEVDGVVKPFGLGLRGRPAQRF